MISAWLQFKKADRLLFKTATALILLASVTLIGIFVDDRIIAAQNIWTKPFKFSVSFAVFLLTMGWIIQYLPSNLKDRYSWGFTILIVIETLAIYIQATRGRASHHNFETVLDVFFYTSMGVAIAINTLLLTWLAIHISTKTKELPLPYMRSIQFGLLLSIIGSFIGVIMSVHKSHSFGGPDGGPGIPFFNWNTLVGDLRFAHFIGLHGLQVMIGFGYFVGVHWQSKIRTRLSYLLVIGIFLILSIITMLAAITAILGLPFYYPLILR